MLKIRNSIENLPGPITHWIRYNTLNRIRFVGKARNSRTPAIKDTYFQI